MLVKAKYIPAGAEFDPPAGFLVSSFVVDRRGGHDHCRLWSRGALAGELVLDAGDGAALAARLGLLAEEPPP